MKSYFLFNSPGGKPPSESLIQQGMFTVLTTVSKLRRKPPGFSHGEYVNKACHPL